MLVRGCIRAPDAEQESMSQKEFIVRMSIMIEAILLRWRKAPQACCGEGWVCCTAPGIQQS